MFVYRPSVDIKTTTYKTDQGQIKFDPPVYEQRYVTALRILNDTVWATDFKKVVDFGCAEMRLMPHLRRIIGIEHILAVDIDEYLLSAYQYRAAPLVSDYLQKREYPLRIDVLQGSIDSRVDCLRNVDAVIALELIEHLYPDVLENIPYNVFGFMQPKLAIFSTPNADFNVLFEPLLANGFRHLDHKFEWSQEQFNDWALNICERFPNYKVSTMGVGEPLTGHEELGKVSQIAIFARLDILGERLFEELNANITADTNEAVQYKEIYSVDYPFTIVNKEQKILHELQYHLQRCQYIHKYLNAERQVYEVPLRILFRYVATIDGSEAEARAILLQNDYTIEGDFVVMPPPPDIESSNSDGENDDHDNGSNRDIDDRDEDAQLLWPPESWDTE